jgi:hypothetical protein
MLQIKIQIFLRDFSPASKHAASPLNIQVHILPADRDNPINIPFHQINHIKLKDLGCQSLISRFHQFNNIHTNVLCIVLCVGDIGHKPYHISRTDRFQKSDIINIVKLRHLALAAQIRPTVRELLALPHKIPSKNFPVDIAILIVHHLDFFQARVCQFDHVF